MEYLKFNNQSGSFSINDVLVGAESGATCTVDIVVQDGSSGGFFTSDRVGDFIDGEIIYVASYGSDLLSGEGAMEETTDFDTDFGTPTTNERSSEQAHGGTYSRKFVGDEQSDGIAKNISVDSGSFYIVTGYAYISALTATGVSVNGYSNAFGYLGGDSTSTTGEWVSLSFVVLTTDTVLRILSVQSGAGAVTAYIDDVLVKKITNAALVNGTIQSASEGFMLGMLLDDAIGLNPKWEYQKDTPKNEYQSRPYEGNLYKTTLGSYKRFNFNVDFITSEHMTIINSWWESGAELFFFITSDSVTEVNTVVLMNDESPINQYKQNTGYFKGSIELESY